MIEEQQQLAVYLQPFDPADEPLMAWLRDNVTPEILGAIVIKSCGHKEAECLQALTAYRDEVILPPCDWTTEALELTRDGYKDPADSGYVGHLKRAFACALLLRIDAEDGRDCVHNKNGTVAVLIHSVIFLGAPAAEMAMQFLCWLVPQYYLGVDENEVFTEREEADLIVLGIIILAVRTQPASMCDDVLPALVGYLTCEHEIDHVSNWPWLLGGTFFDLMHDLWQSLVATTLCPPPDSLSDTLKASLAEIGARLVPA